MELICLGQHFRMEIGRCWTSNPFGHDPSKSPGRFPASWKSWEKRNGTSMAATTATMFEGRASLGDRINPANFSSNSFRSINGDRSKIEEPNAAPILNESTSSVKDPRSRTRRFSRSIDHSLSVEVSGNSWVEQYYFTYHFIFIGGRDC